MTKKNPKKTTQKIYSLQGIRALSFLLIFILHCGFIVPAELGVTIFFTLSGFLMTYSYHDKTLETSLKSCINFSKRKISRLYLLHILTTLMAIYISIKTLGIGSKIINLIIHVLFFSFNSLLIQTFIPQSIYYFSLNGVAWYLSACFFLYITFPFVLKKIRNRSCVQTILIAFTFYSLQLLSGYMTRNIIGLSFISDNFSKWFTYIFPIYRLGDFVAGCCIGHLYMVRKTSITRMKAILLELSALFAVALSIFIYIKKVPFFSASYLCSTTLFIPCALLLIYSVSLDKGILSEFLAITPMVWLGNISPYAFLIHQLVIRYIEFIYSKITNNDINMYLKFFVCFIITILCTETYIWIENFIKRHITKNNFSWK